MYTYIYIYMYIHTYYTYIYIYIERERTPTTSKRSRLLRLADDEARATGRRDCEDSSGQSPPGPFSTSVEGPARGRPNNL